MNKKLEVKFEVHTILVCIVFLYAQYTCMHTTLDKISYVLNFT